MRPKILFVITDSGVGGTEKVLLELLRGLDRKRFDLCGVVVLKGRREMAALWEQEGVPVTSLGMNYCPTVGTLMGVREAIRRFRPDIVHAFLYHSVQLVRLASFLSPKFKLVSSPRVNYRFISSGAVWIDRLLKFRDSAALCESSATQKFLIERLNYNPKKTKVVRNGVDVSQFRFDAPGRRRWRAEWSVKDDEVLIGSIGRLHSQKGYDLLIDALEKLRGGPVKFKCVIVGDGPERSNLEEKIRHTHVPLELVGPQSAIPGILSAFDIFVQSSRYEGMSNALLEAMSVGVPIAATAVDGTLDIAQDGENMLLVKPDDSLSLSVAIGLLLEKEGLRQRLANNAKTTALAFSRANMIKGFEECYSALLEPAKE